MSESKFRKYLCEGLNSMGAHTSMIESHSTSTGFPDVNYCFGVCEGNIECKYQDETSKLKIKPSQKRWFKQRVKSGGNCWLIGYFEYSEEAYILVRGEYIKHLNDDVESWLRWATCVWHGHKSIDFLQLLKHI